jgi:hypothetical protein
MLRILETEIRFFTPQLYHYRPASLAAFLLIRSIRHGMDETINAMSLLPRLAERPRAHDQNSREAYPALLDGPDRGRSTACRACRVLGNRRQFLSPTLASWAKSRSQYSSERRIVRTRLVTGASAGSGE